MTSHRVDVQADRLLELFAEMQERALARTRKREGKEQAREHVKERQAGYSGPLEQALTFDRCHWPALHNAVLENHVPLVTVPINGDPRRLTIRTTCAGALHLQAVAHVESES